jgi:heat shock transcription factor 1
MPKFIRKLYKMVESPETNKIVRWTKSGHAFIISDFAAFTSSVMCMYYPGIKFMTFHRYLNLFNFTRVNCKFDSERVFKNANFRRGRVDLLTKIGSPQDKKDHLNSDKKIYSTFFNPHASNRIVSDIQEEARSLGVK